VLAKYRIKEGLDLCKELAIEERDKSTGWVPWYGMTLIDTLPNYGKDAEPVVKVIETWSILKGRGATDLAKKLPELKKKVEASQKLQLKSISGTKATGVTNL